MKNLIVVLALIAGVDRVTAVSVSLAWNPSTNSTVTGYKVYYGTASGVYATNIAAGNVTNVTISGLASGTYYFAATSYDASGNESGYSSEISYTVTNQTVVAGATLTANSSIANGQFSFSVTGASGSQYVVQASTDMANWVTLETNTSPFTVVDTNAGAFPKRFYRAVSLY